MADDESDDDLYGSTNPTTGQKKDMKGEDGASSGDEPMDEGQDSAEDDDDDDEEDSDSDIEIIIDKQIAPKHATQPQQPSESKAIKIEAPPQASSAPSQAPKSIAKGAVPQLLPGTAYPAQSTSTIDVNGNPVYPPQGKEIMQVDMDADIAEEQRIWRRPGEDQTDYFNYGFDEFTWEMYRQRHAAMAQTIQQQKSEVMQMEQMMNMNQMPGMPNNPGLGAGAMDEQKQMQMVIQRMQNQGLDPSQMNFTEFAAFMQMPGQDMGSGFGGPGGPGGPGGQQHGGNFHQGNHGGGRGGRGGRGRGW